MSIYVWKGAIVIGLGLCLAGLILMIQAHVFRTNGKTWANMHNPNPKLNKLGWLLTILGYVLQGFGVIAS